MKIKSGNKEIIVTRNMNVGSMAVPPHITLAMKHIEKEQPTPSKLTSGEVSYVVPIDLVRLVQPDEIVNEIASFEVTFKRKAATP